MMCSLKEYFLFTENKKDIENGVDTCDLMSLIKDSGIWNVLIERSFDKKKLQEYYSGLSLEQRSTVFKFGISCLVHFVQANFTGPELINDVAEVLNSPETSKYSYEDLNPDYDEINVNTKFPLLLFIAKSIFQDCEVEKIVNSLWHWRTLIIYQHVMIGVTSMFLAEVDVLEKQIDTFNLQGYTKAKFDLEFAQLYLLLRDITKSKKHIDSAENILGIKYDLSGQLGKRTKYQERNLAQLTLEVSLLSDDSEIKQPPVHEFEIPKDITLDDEVRLDKINFLEPQEKAINLPNTEQKVVLSRAQEMIIAKPSTEFIEEEVLPYLDVILSQRNTWTVRVVTLLLRCRYENSKRTISRKISQCEEILNCIKKTKPHVLHRFADVFSSGMKPIWKIKSDLADTLKSMDLIKSALDIYTTIQDWESMIQCYALIDLKHKAEELIRKQLDIKETPKMLCWLGDVTDDITCYEKAWELSNGRSVMAKTRLGNYYYKRKQYEECIPFFEESISMNPLQSHVLYKLGYAALTTKKWELAISAYKRYTYLEQEGYEVWNNLATALMKMKRNEEAHSALAEALKYNFENWHIWDNYLNVSCDISSYSNIIRAYHKILDLTNKYVNIPALKKLALDAFDKSSDESKHKELKYDEAPELLMKQTRELFGRITSMGTCNGYVWELYAKLCPPGPDRVSRLQRAFRAYTQLDWNKDTKNCVKVLCLCNKIAELVLNDDYEFKYEQLNSTRMNLKSAVAGVKKFDWEETGTLLKEVSANLEALTEKTKSLRS